jgi:predicted nuclease of predicted toxin-antitoxin system
VDFIADQTIPEPSVEEIRTLGNLVDVVEVDSDDARRAVVDRAAREDKIVLSFDFDYHDIIFEDAPQIPPGLVCFRLDLETPRDPAHLLVAVLTDEDLGVEDRFTLLEKDRMRQKTLET